MFLPPNTTAAVFIDNYHVNFGGPGFDLETGSPSPTSYLYDGTDISVFGTEYNLVTNALRPLRPLSNTFCSAGSFFADGTLANVAGAEPITKGVAGKYISQGSLPIPATKFHQPQSFYRWLQQNSYLFTWSLCWSLLNRLDRANRHVTGKEMVS